MTLSRRDVLKNALSVTALAGLNAAAATVAPPNASGDEGRLIGVNVKDYGAVGDGNIDDTAAIHAARDVAGVGGKIVIPPGTYMVSGLTADVADQTWELLSNGTVLKMKTGADSALSVTADGVTIQGGVFDASNGTLHDWNQHGIIVAAADHVTIRNATIQNSPKHAIYGLNCNDVTVTGCTTTNNWGSGIYFQNTLAGPSDIADYLITENLIDNSMVTSDDYGGIIVRGASLTRTVSRVTISDNTVRMPSGGSNVRENISVTCGIDWVVDGNIITGGWGGISCEGPQGAIISNNIIRGFHGIGIELGWDVKNVTVTGNSINADGVDKGQGISVSSAGSPSPVQDLTISNNTIDGFPTGTSYGIAFGSGAILNRVIITGNSLTSAVNPGQFYGVFCSESVTNLNIVGNIIDASSTVGSYGIAFLSRLTGVSITSNQFSNIAETAVLLSGSGGPYDHITFVGNQVRNCGAGLGGAGLASATNVVSDSR